MFRPRHGISTLMFLLVILHDSTIVKTTGKKRTRQHDTSNYVVDLQPMRLNYIDESCNDGSKAGFYFRPSANSKAGLWVVFLEGGGWCYDKESCATRFASASGLMSSKNWESTKQESKGILSQDCGVNPGFCEANHVYVRYCSSDGWSGDRVEKSDIGFSFRGARIVDELITTLTTNASFGPMDPLEAKVLFTGCSAGGRGAMFNMDRVKSRLPNAYGLFDSGWWLAIDPMARNSSHISLVQQAQLGYDLYNASLDESCLASQIPTERWKCFFAPITLPFVQTPSLSQVFQYDKFQLSEDTGGLKPPYDKEAAAYAEQFRSAMMQSFATVADRRSHNDNNDDDTGRISIYSPACYDHCSIESSRFALTRPIAPGGGGNGSSPTLSELVTEWFFNVSSSRRSSEHVEAMDSQIRIIDACNSFNCSHSC
mmetsp:Transcript_13922/g.22197  ORF Transcript_13922/g.22197 Transcript_13922/m.22197 type:complete len:427 (-) Transcript_13922:95-1375(-)